MARSKGDILWVRRDVFNNHISFHVEKWEHASKHAFDKYPTTEEHIYQAIINPDHARRSLDPVMADDACVFEKFFEVEQQRFFVPVLYDGISAPGEYEHGGKKGKVLVLTGYFPDGRRNSNTIGEIFWSKSTSDVQKESK